ncbi:MAG: AMP-binding protein, partial [Gammaproteobacteria bacterium]
MSETLAALEARRQHAGDAPALLGSTDRVSVNEALGVLAIAADNSPDWVIADLAAQRAEIAVVPLPPFFSADQIAHVIADSGADAIAADEAGSQPLASFPTRFAAELTSRLSLLKLPSNPGGTALPEKTAKISYTSGTTSSPKGVCLTQ